MTGLRFDTYDWPGGREAMLRFGPDNGPIVVAALPLFEEANRTRQFTCTILRALAERGVGSMLPDFPGTGESVVATVDATLTDQRFTAGSGSLLVKPNLAAISANTVVEGRTPAEVNLANIEAEIAARITGGATLEYTIGNRSLKREPMAMLMTLRSQYRLIVYREKQAQAGANGGKLSNWVGVRFK